MRISDWSSDVCSSDLQATLTKALEGKVAGKPQSCMSMIPRAALQVISDDVLLYKIGRTVYVNRMMGNCSGLTNGRTLVSNVWGSQVCRGDIARVADLNVGMITGDRKSTRLTSSH